MAIYSWGNTTHGELGLGGIEDELISKPTEIVWPIEDDIKQISCGRWHTLFLTVKGKMYSCGSNDCGQLAHDLPTKRPQLIETLQSYEIVQIKCGGNYSYAINEYGHLYCWGQNDFGQLGVDIDEDNVTPRVMRQLVPKHMVQIACGNNHCLALSNRGELFAWGSNVYGQLGVANTNDVMYITDPNTITVLAGIPIAFIACGGYHSFAISKSGAVFGWGKNENGQLGLNDTTNRSFPTQLKTLRTLGVRYIACGDEFSVFLTNDGGVFTCGSGTYGQLGHGSTTNEVLPRMVMELMGSTVTQVACGSRHTLGLVPSRGRVYGFGLGCSGQLGTRSTNNCAVPQVVVGPWVSPSGSALLPTDENMSTSVVIKQIYSGGDHSLVTTTPFTDKVPAVDFRCYGMRTQILELTNELIKRCGHLGKDYGTDIEVLNALEDIFRSQACLNGSFLLRNDKHFLCCTSKHHGVDLERANLAFQNLGKIENNNLKKVVYNYITNEILNSLVPSPADVETLRIYLIIPLYHEFVNSKHYEQLHSKFSNAVLQLNDIPKKIVCKWWAQLPNEYFERMVSNYRDAVAYIISFKIPVQAGTYTDKRIVPYNANLVAAFHFLVFLYDINHTERTSKIHYEVFHWPELADYVDITQEYIRWLFDKNPEEFNICNYPFLFDASAKTTLLQTDQAIQMHNAMRNAANTGFLATMLSFGNMVSQFIYLNVSRENIVQDTLREIMQYNDSDLKKPIKVKFTGEEGEDAGGVRKEFFMLLLKDLIDPKYGMFKEFEDSRAFWFADISFETDDMYFLIGVICGLAIYNFTIINLPFPLALYKKLLHEPVDLDDLHDLSPTLANSMRSILDYEGDDFEAVFDITFEISREIFGETKSVPLKPNGNNIPVTLENKQEFVDLYMDFIFHKSAETQFNAFQKGFMKVCWGRVLQIFKPQELMAVVVGNEEYDWQSLETNCEYRNGYSSGDKTVKWFWDVFHGLNEEEKKKFLLFLTGSDRIPIQGMKAIKVCIQPTSDDRYLPVAHTCFNLLDLPRYKTKERLKYKLLQAIQQTQGFSIV